MTRREELPAAPEPVPAWVAPLFALLGLLTVPWTAYLAVTLPDQVSTGNYRAAWVGFDAALVVVLLATGYLAWRAHRTVGLVASAAATMLAVDAWFDVTTSDRAGLPWAVLLAVLVELPLAVLCGWIALHTDRVVERRLQQLARRAARVAGRNPAAATAQAGVRAATAGAQAAEQGAQTAATTGRAAEQAVRQAEEAAGQDRY